MIGHLAAYDPAIATPIGDYWIWKSEAVDKNTRGRFYADIYGAHPPHDPNAIGADDVHGGCLARGNWACFYRFYDGGRDLRGRPGRFVLLCLFVARSEIVGRDCSEWLETGPLAVDPHVLAAAGSPTQPTQLNPTIQAPPLPAAAPKPAVTKYVGESAPGDAWSRCGALSSEHDFHWKVDRRERETSAEVVIEAVDEPLAEASSRPVRFTDRGMPSADRSTRVEPSSAPINFNATKSYIPRISKLTYLGFILGIAIGFTAALWLVPNHGGASDSRVLVDLAEMKAFFQRSRSFTNGIESLTDQQREELLRRIENNNWSPASPPAAVDDAGHRGVGLPRTSSVAPSSDVP